MKNKTKEKIPPSMEKIVVDMRKRLEEMREKVTVKDGEDISYLTQKTDELLDRHVSIMKSNITRHINTILEDRIEKLNDIYKVKIKEHKTKLEKQTEETVSPVFHKSDGLPF